MHVAISFYFTQITNTDRAQICIINNKCMGLYENLTELIPLLFHCMIIKTLALSKCKNVVKFGSYRSQGFLGDGL